MDIARAEVVEAELDRFIWTRHERRVAEEDERPVWWRGWNPSVIRGGAKARVPGGVVRLAPRSGRASPPHSGGSDSPSRDTGREALRVPGGGG